LLDESPRCFDSAQLLDWNGRAFVTEAADNFIETSVLSAHEFQARLTAGELEFNLAAGPNAERIPYCFGDDDLCFL
jgi:hypothetical protein